jgi:glycosyltransferase involved in cell wall biosynthesis
LATKGVDVYCVVLEAAERDRNDAKESGVQLIIAERVAGSSEREALSRRPKLPEGVIPDLIIGHGRITGRAAMVIASDHFPNVPRLHILHMNPDQTEWLKPDREHDAGLTAEQRMKEERALLRPPVTGAGVGPQLHELCQAEFAAFPQAHDPIRIDPGFDIGMPALRKPPRGRPVRISLFGRLEDYKVKGLDIAARGLAEAVDLLGLDPAKVELVLRGVPHGQSSKIRDEIYKWAGKKAFRVVTRTYTEDAEELEEDFLRSTLVLVPSRADGFALAGAEAITAGTPVLISDACGLADLLREVLGEEATRLVVPVRDDDREDARQWGAAITAALVDTPAAFAHMERVRTVMAKERTWEMAAEAVLRVIR